VENVSTVKLKELGFDKAASDIDAGVEYKRKVTIATENFRYVTPDQFTAFNQKLRRDTEKGDSRHGRTYDQLVCIPIDAYPEVPPANVLNDLAQATEKNCFDTFEIAKIESIQELPDPILFGRIKGCANRFFISQWDNDVKISDIIGDNEG